MFYCHLSCKNLFKRIKIQTHTTHLSIWVRTVIISGKYIFLKQSCYFTWLKRGILCNLHILIRSFLRLNDPVIREITSIRNYNLFMFLFIHYYYGHVASRGQCLVPICFGKRHLNSHTEK